MSRKSHKKENSSELLEALKPLQGPAWWQWLLWAIVPIIISVIFMLAAFFVWINPALRKATRAASVATITPAQSESITPQQNQHQQPVRRLELQYPPSVVATGPQPVRVLATLLENENPVPGADVVFSSSNPSMAFAEPKSMKTNVSGQAWVDIPVDVLGPGAHEIAIRVQSGELMRQALIYVEVPAPEEETRTVEETPPPVLDRDGDGLTDTQETILGTNPDVADSDGDGGKDGEEFFAWQTSPARSNRYQFASQNDIKSVDGEKVGVSITPTVPLFNLEKVNADNDVLFYLDALVAKSDVESGEVTSLSISNAYYTTDRYAKKNTEFFDPEDGTTLWIRLEEKQLPVIILEEQDDEKYLVRFFFRVSQDMVKPFESGE